MADMNNRPHYLGSGHPHHQHHVLNHTRPFLYVQPPSQPFYMYQWNMNLNPYGNPASGLPYMRQYMTPYPYMSGYPSYVIPQAPIYPVDYRRMFNPHLSSSSAYDVHLRHHRSCFTKETASSEVQTDQSNLLTKLTESLDALTTCKIAEKDEKEPVTSDTKVLPPEIVTQPSLDIGKTNEMVLKPLAERRLPVTRQTEADLNSHTIHQPHSHTLPPALPSDSTSQELSNTESTLSNLGKASWALKAEAHMCDKAQDDTQSLVSGIVILPLDSSSVNGEDEDVQYSLEAPCQAEKLHHTVALELMNGKGNLGVEAEEDLPYRILRLPCDKVTTGMLQQDQPLWFMDPSTSTTLPTQNYLSLASSHSAYYSYYPHPAVQVATERQSILSPSIDELSSKDELFSTDTDNLDNDLIVGGGDVLSSEPIYLSGGKMATNGEIWEGSGKKNCIPLVAQLSKMCLQTCICCGKSLGKNDERMTFGREKGGRMHCEYMERPDGAEHEEYRGEVVTEGAEVPHYVCYSSTRSLPHAYPTPPYLPPLHLYPRRRSRKTCDCEEHGRVEEMAVHNEQQGHVCGQGPDYCPPAAAASKMNKYKGKGQRNPPARTYNGKPWIERPAAAAPDSGGSCGSKYKVRSSRPHNGTDEECLQHKRPACKTFLQQKPRRTYHDYKESEATNKYRSRGSTTGRSTRY